jgi:outer membrane protein assembly factor BamE (lipoprotein component of BamABCDE complex)
MADRTAGGRLAVWLGLVGIAISAGNLVGCSSQDVGAPTSSPQRFEQEVLNLPQGASLGDVKANLGKPVSEATYGSEATLTYRSWGLHFRDGELRQRVRETRSGRTSLSGRILDHKVLLRVMPGMTVREVRETLGTPEVYEQIYESALKPAVVLRYAYWELYFPKGRLVRRTKN